jgi:hypothetical protein
VITEPTIILLAKSDGVSPPRSSERHDRFSTDPYQRRVGPVAGHFLPRETPEAVVEAVRELASRPEEGIPCSPSTPISRSLIWLSGSSSIVAGRRGLEEEPLASQHPDPGVQESSHLIESGRDGFGRRVAGPRCQQIKEILTHRLFAASMAWTNSLDPAPHFVKTLSAVVNGTSTGCTRSGGRM